eukprot:526195_1
MASMNEVVTYTTTGDLSNFRKNQSECVASDYTKFNAMQRLITSSKMYSMHMRKLNPSADPNELEILTRFMNEVYTDKRLIDDHIHFKEEHDDEIERINRDLIESKRFSDCSIRNCCFTTRHMDVQSTSTIASDRNSKLSFYGEIFDAFHFHVFHCFEAGLRTTRIDDNDEMGEEEKATNDQYFDAPFARMNCR